MKSIATSSITAAAVLLASQLVAAAEPTTLVQTDVSIVANGAVIGDVRLPRGASFHIVSDRTTMRQPEGESNADIVASGNATLVARLDGRDVMTLKGDQLVLRRR